MTALTARRRVKRRTGEIVTHPVAAGAHVFEGALVALEGGYAKPAYEAGSLVAAGVARVAADNTSGQDGAIKVDVMRGIFAFENAGDVTRGHIGAQAWMVDDQTVAAGSNSNGRSPAGKIVDVNEDGVWVDIG